MPSQDSNLNLLNTSPDSPQEKVFSVRFGHEFALSQCPFVWLFIKPGKGTRYGGFNHEATYQEILKINEF